MKHTVSRIRRKLSGGRNRKRNRTSMNIGFGGSLASMQASAVSAGRWFGRILPYVLIGLFSASIPPLLVYGYRFVTNSAEFSAKRVVVSGNDRLSPEQVLDVAGVSHGPNVLTLDLNDLSERLSEHAWIESATVSRELPDRLMMKIKERQPAAIVAMGARYLVDAKGDIFRRVESNEIYDLPTITGLARDDLDSGASKERRDLAQRMIKGALSLLDTWKRSDPNGALPVSEVHPDPLFGYTLTLRGGDGSSAGAVIHLGRGDIALKVSKLAVVVADANRRGQSIAVVRLDNQRDPGRVAVRFRNGDAVSQIGNEELQTQSKTRVGAGSGGVGHRRL